jgi:hypothetical protein
LLCFVVGVFVRFRAPFILVRALAWRFGPPTSLAANLQQVRISPESEGGPKFLIDSVERSNVSVSVWYLISAS